MPKAAVAVVRKVKREGPGLSSQLETACARFVQFFFAIWARHLLAALGAGLNAGTHQGPWVSVVKRILPPYQLLTTRAKCVNSVARVLI